MALLMRIGILLCLVALGLGRFHAWRCTKGLNGTCLPIGTCPGHMKATPPGRPYCANGKQHCCYPGPTGLLPSWTASCPEECTRHDNCFFVGSTYQCFCTFDAFDEDKNPLGTWDWAKNHCKNKSMVLPHPGDIVALASESVQMEGQCGPLWLNAVCNAEDNELVWQDRGEPNITMSSPLFCNDPIVPPYQPPSTCPEGFCLHYDCSDVSMSECSEKPYRIANCSQANYNIICEKLCN